MKRFLALAGLVLCLLPVAGPAADETVAPPGGYLAGPRFEAQSAGDVFGGRTGYVHPYLSVGQIYTDNFFNTPDNEEDEWVTVVTPGIWGAFPAMKQAPEKTTTLNTTPGGMPLTRFRQDTGRRFQLYGGYSADFYRNENFSDQEETIQRGEAMLDVNLRGGLGMNLLAVYDDTHDPYSTGVNQLPQTDDYTALTLNDLVTWEIGPRTDLRLEVGYYALDYDDARNAFRDRDDLKGGLALGYRLTPKTRLFVQYEYIDIRYDREIQDDSEEHHYFAGLSWQLTAKSRGMVKAGYGQKKFDHRSSDDKDEFIGELQLSHQLTPKSSLNLAVTRQTNESDISGTDDRLSDFVSLGYLWKMTAKTSLKLDLSWLRDEYNDQITIGGQTGFRDDDYLRCGLGVGWNVRKWLNVSFGYAFEQRDSNFDTFDYDNNAAYLNLTAVM
ncbi:hypothetical protein EDC39_107139 [Geothermobacter ehrlichii]|uniref:Beta-barrel porin 2 n=1 Tax=Geothermobacter ehrlichii TaxID=213224 RepID=A0A5D3WJG9_9BACT|nr:outer membrane beta-barrel protein [Geothermobacter ehrlichii]TYO98338.1 hypothetical protein EDC39_107139 [Geothermobacter ehrlichii]